MVYLLRLAKRAAALLLVMASAAHAAPQTVTYYYTDPQGTVLATADEHGNLITTEDRKPYGEQVLGAPRAGPGYTGHVDDPSTGLTYMQARFYDPTVGRFLSADPTMPSAGKLAQFGRYGYADGNPVGNIDPDGRQTLPPSTYQIDWQDQRTRQEVVNLAISVTPVVGDLKNISDAVQDPTYLNIAAATIGVVPDGGTAVARALKGTDEAAKVGSAASKIDRAAFRTERSAFWKSEATKNPGKYSENDLANMQKGKAPTGSDGHPMELHHLDGTPEGGVTPMTRTDHRTGDNYKDNHPWLHNDD